MGYKDPNKQREYCRLWVAARRAAWLSVNGPCARCQSWDNLEVDHIDRSAKVSHRVWSWSEKRRTEELAKCQVLCWSCHYRKGEEYGDVHLRNNHGTYGMYEKHGCRCDLCRAAHTAYQGQWRRSKKLLGEL